MARTSLLVSELSSARNAMRRAGTVFVCLLILPCILIRLTLKDAGGPKVPSGQEIVCHFPQDHAMVTKNLDFIHKYPN